MTNSDNVGNDGLTDEERAVEARNYRDKHAMPPAELAALDQWLTMKRIEIVGK